MKTLKNKIIGIVMGLLVVLGNGFCMVGAEEVTVNTGTIDTIQVETPTTNETEVTTPTEKDEVETETEKDDVVEEVGKITSTDKNLKDTLYEGDIIVDNGVTFDSLFERLATKGRSLVEDVRKTCIPALVLAWIALFAISVLRILTGERGASSRLVGGLLLITIAYCGIVYAEVIMTGLVKFFAGQ